jgi:hypothetical protein
MSAAKEVESEIKNGFEQWCIVELMGHVRMAGKVTEQELFGTKLARIDIPSPDGGQSVTQYFGGSSVYRITPVTEELARAVAAHNSPAPIHIWELPKGLKPAPGDDDDDDEPEF